MVSPVPKTFSTGQGAAAVQFDRMKQGLTPDFIPSRLFIYYNERVIEGTVNEDSGAQTVASWATAISKGPATESTQTVDFLVTNNNNALFTTAGQPAVPR